MQTCVWIGSIALIPVVGARGGDEPLPLPEWFEGWRVRVPEFQISACVVAEYQKMDTRKD
jgi:hypothetical protein